MPKEMEEKDQEIIFDYYGKEYSVVPERKQFIFSEIKEEKRDEGRKKVRRNKKYYTTIESFLRHLRKIKLSNSQNETLEDMAESIAKFNKWAKNTFKILEDKNE